MYIFLLKVLAFLKISFNQTRDVNDKKNHLIFNRVREGPPKTTGLGGGGR